MIYLVYLKYVVCLFNRRSVGNGGWTGTPGQHTSLCLTLFDGDLLTKLSNPDIFNPTILK